MVSLLVPHLPDVFVFEVFPSADASVLRGDFEPQVVRNNLQKLLGDAVVACCDEGRIAGSMSICQCVRAQVDIRPWGLPCPQQEYIYAHIYI